MNLNDPSSEQPNATVNSVCDETNCDMNTDIVCRLKKQSLNIMSELHDTVRSESPIQTCDEWVAAERNRAQERLDQQVPGTSTSEKDANTTTMCSNICDSNTELNRATDTRHNTTYISAMNKTVMNNTSVITNNGGNINNRGNIQDPDQQQRGNSKDSHARRTEETERDKRRIEIRDQNSDDNTSIDVSTTVSNDC